MLVTLVTNKEGRFPGFKAEFFQLPKMKGEQSREGCAQFASDASTETWKRVTSWLLELTLAAVTISPEEAKIRLGWD